MEASERAEDFFLREAAISATGFAASGYTNSPMRVAVGRRVAGSRVCVGMRLWNPQYVHVKIICFSLVAYQTKNNTHVRFGRERGGENLKKKAAGVQLSRTVSVSPGMSTVSHVGQYWCFTLLSLQSVRRGLMSEAIKMNYENKLMAEIKRSQRQGLCLWKKHRRVDG